MKRAILTIFIAAFICIGVFADTLDFSVRWYVSNVPVSELSIIPYSGEGSFPKVVPEGGTEAVSHTELQTEGIEQVEVCRIRFSTNVHALYNMSIKATSLYCEELDSHVGYYLYLNHDSTGSIYEVSNSSTLDSDGHVLQVGMWGNGTVTNDVMVTAVFAEYESMLSGSYHSTLRVEVAIE